MYLLLSIYTCRGRSEMAARADPMPISSGEAEVAGGVEIKVGGWETGLTQEASGIYRNFPTGRYP